MSERKSYSFRHRKIILASGSPRRRELLAQMGLEFEVLITDADECVAACPQNAVRELAERKARAAAQYCDDGLIIAADTLVALEDEALGKPLDRQDAARMLGALSGRSHQVFTGVCLKDAATGREMARVDRTEVKFRQLSETEIFAYIDGGEPMDKAGAYAIQGGAGAFVESIQGSFSNVMGLPTEMLAEMLMEMGM